MNRGDTARLLAVIQAFDRRTIGDGDVIAWSAVLDDLDYGECADAVVMHQRNSPGVWLEPGHIRAIVKAARADWADRNAAVEHHAAIAAVPYEQSAAHAAYLEASQVLRDAVEAKYARLGEPPPRFSDHPFRRWTPRVARKAKDTR